MCNIKINILFVLIQVHQGGTERVVIDLIKSLDKSKFNSYLAYFEEGELVREFSSICKETFHITKRRGLDPTAMLSLSRIIKHYAIDVINAQHYMPFFYSFLGSKILNYRKLIYVEHSVPEVQEILKSKHRRIFGLLLRHTDAVVGISKEIGDTLQLSYPEFASKFQVILNGVDVDHFTQPVDRDKLRSLWGISSKHFVIGTVANFRKVKNHACLIRALNQLKVTEPNVRVMLVGQGFRGDQASSERELVDLINKYGLQERVIMTGYQNDVARLLKAFDVFCLPSFSEGLPVSILEAMAAGIPVVGSDVKGIHEVISQDRTGLLFPSDDECALALVLEELIGDGVRRDRLARQAFQYVKHTHGIKQWVSAYETLFTC